MQRTALLVLFFSLVGTPAAQCQCILANPSFELPGSGGDVFAGWSQFGSVGSVANATHGAVAARVSGPNLGGWDVSAFWQNLDTAPGERWEASVCVSHTSANPLTGQSKAILNIEWRDAGGGLISYESHVAADAATPIDEVFIFSVVSQPAPLGTASTHILLGVLQSPADPPPDVIYDEATFEMIGPPSPEDLQWGDFPGGRTLSFGGRTWRVKGPGYYGPGPSLFCDTADCTWVDAEERLHLTIQESGGSWYSTELVLDEALGYGDYIFTTYGRLDQLHPNAVFGLFIWEYGPCYDPANGWWNPYNEIDIEFSRWGNPANEIGQFVAQPYDYPGNLDRFDAAFSAGELTSHAFRWLPDRVEYRSWRGGPEAEGPGTLIHGWTYAGPHIPRPERPRVHLNLWQFSGPPDVNQEVVLDTFTFVAECVPPHCQDGTIAVPESPVVPVRSWARPNPFGVRTTIHYTVTRAGESTVLIHDIAGRLVRTLSRGFEPAGDYGAIWDGRGDDGTRVAAGVYQYRIRTGPLTESGRVVLIR